MHYRKLGFALLALVAVMVLAPSAPAAAAGKKTFLSFRSEPGDDVGLGETRTFTRSDGVMRAAEIGNGNQIHVRIDEPNGTEWDLNLAAPAGQKLEVGAYTNVARWLSPPNSSTQPTMSFSGDGRGCSTITGRFDVLAVSFGAKGVIESFHATFEQHCEGFAPALFGEVSLAGVPAWPANTVGATLNPTGSIDRESGLVTLYGTLTCSVAPFAVFDVTIGSGDNESSFPGFAFCDHNGEPYAVSGYLSVDPQGFPAVASVAVHVDAQDPIGLTTASADVTGNVAFP